MPVYSLANRPASLGISKRCRFGCFSRGILKLMLSKFPIDTTLRTVSWLKTLGEIPFSPILKPFFFFFSQVLRDLWFVRLPQLNQWRQWSCTAYGWKACQSPLEWVWHLAIRCKPAYLTLSRHKYFSRSLHPPWPAILCGCERSGLVRWKQYTVCWTTAGHWQLQVPKIHGQSCGARAPPVVEGYG